MRPTKSQVFGFDFGNMPDAAKGADTIGNQIEADGRNIEATINGLDWSGRFHHAATSRAHREKVQFTRVDDALEKLRDAITNGHDSMSHITERLKTGTQGWEAASYTVAEDWHVTDNYNYALAEAVYQNDDAALARIETLKAKRANNAATATVRLQRLAFDFDEADAKCAADIRSAVASIAALTPLESALGDGIADRIGEKLRDGKPLTDFERKVLEMGTNLDPDERAALEHGKPATMTQGEFDFLSEIVGDLDGLSMEQILALGKGPHHGEIQNNLANATQLLGIPKLGTTSGDHGGMAALPPNIRTLLTTNLAGQDRPGVLDRIVSRVSPQGDQLDGPRIKRLNDFIHASEFFNKSDEEVRLGSDINRGVLKQAAEIAGASAGADNASDANGSLYLSAEQLDKALNTAIAGASADRVATHDFITGENMNVTCDNGGKYDAFSHLNDLADQRWGEANGLKTLFGHVGGDVNAENKYFADLAHESAGKLGHYLGSADDFDVNKSLGMKSPEFARILADAVHPYFGSYVGGDGYAGLPEYGVGRLSADEMERLFASLSGDPEAAAKLYSEVGKWENLMGVAYGNDPTKVSLGAMAGFLGQSFGDGAQSAIDNYTGAQKETYEDKLALFGAAKDASGLIPFVGKASWLLQQPLADALFGKEPDVNSTQSDWTKRVLPDGTPDPAMSTSPSALNFSIAKGYLETHPEETWRFAPFMTHGELDWNKVQDNLFKFNDEVNANTESWHVNHRNGRDEANAPEMPGTK